MRAGGRAARPARDKGDGGRQGIAMALFMDTFVNKIDRKGRVSVPAPYRTSLAAEGFATQLEENSAVFGWG